MMKRILTALLTTGIAATHAATLYMGDGTTSDLSGAISPGVQDWDTTSSIWTTNQNPAAYQTYVQGSDVVLLGETPIPTVTENIVVSNIYRSSNVGNNASRADIAVNNGATLTINGVLDGMPLPLDTATRQWNLNGPGAIEGNLILTNSSRMRIEDSITSGNGLTITSEDGGNLQFYNDVGDVSTLTLKMSTSGGNFLQINADSLTINALHGTATLQTRGFNGFFTVNSLNPGADSDGTGTGSFYPDTTRTWDKDFALGTGTHTFDINADTAEADKLDVGNGTIQFGGTLTVTNIAGPLSSGQIFTLFAANSFTNTFSATNLPALGGSLSWDLSNLDVDGTIRVSGGLVDEYSGTLYLGDGTTYANNPATWNTTSDFWGLGPVAAESVFTNWIDGSTAVIYGNGDSRDVNLAVGLNVTVNELEWDTTSGAVSLIGDGSQTLTITNEMRTVLTETPRQINLESMTLAGQFDAQNVSRISLSGDVAAGTEINLLDVSDIQFVPGAAADLTNLSVTLNGVDSWVYNKSDGNVTMGNLNGTGEIRMDADSPLTINNVTVGGISNSATIVANGASAGDLTLGGGTHNFSINPNTGNTDLLDAGPGTLTYGGDLIVGANNTDELSLGQTFQLFDAAAITGSFNSVVLPESQLPEGAVWYNDLDTDGTISVGTPGLRYSSVRFGKFLNESTWVAGETTMYGSITNTEGTVLTLTFSAVTPAGDTLFANKEDYLQGIDSTVSTNDVRYRFDSGNIGDTSDDEQVQLSLAVTGTDVSSLEFISIDTAFNGDGNPIELVDATLVSTVFTNGSTITASDLLGLQELTKDNVGSWTLDMIARESESGVQCQYSIDAVEFLVTYKSNTEPTESPTISSSFTNGSLIMSWADDYTYNILTNSDLTDPSGWGVSEAGAESPVTNAVGSETNLFYKLEF